MGTVCEELRKTGACCARRPEARNANKTPVAGTSTFIFFRKATGELALCLAYDVSRARWQGKSSARGRVVRVGPIRPGVGQAGERDGGRDEDRPSAERDRGRPHGPSAEQGAKLAGPSRQPGRTRGPRQRAQGEDGDGGRGLRDEERARGPAHLLLARPLTGAIPDH